MFAGCIGIGVYITVATYGTGVSGITLFATSGIGYHGFIIVIAKTCAFRLSEDCTTFRTLCSCGKAFSLAIANYCAEFNNGMFAGCRNFGLSNKNFATYFAVLTFGQAGSSASCFNCFVDYFGVRKFFNNFLRGDNGFTDGAHYTVGQTCFSTSSCLAGDCCFGMFTGCEDNLSGVVVATGTLLTFGVTIFATGRILCFNVNEIVAESGFNQVFVGGCNLIFGEVSGTTYAIVVRIITFVFTGCAPIIN